MFKGSLSVGGIVKLGSRGRPEDGHRVQTFSDEMREFWGSLGQHVIVVKFVSYAWKLLRE